MMDQDDGDDNSERRPDILPIPSPSETQWEFVRRTNFGNNIFIGYNPDTRKYQACSDKEPLFIVPPEKSLARVEDQIKYMLTAYAEYLKNKAESVTK